MRGASTGLLREPRTTFEGEHYRMADAPNQPKPVQARLPILIGGGGEKRTMKIAARYADEWNVWRTPEVLAHKVGVLRRHCDDLGRDPTEIAVSTQAMLFLSTDEGWLADKRGNGIAGTPAEVDRDRRRVSRGGLRRADHPRLQPRPDGAAQGHVRPVLHRGRVALPLTH